MQWVSKRCSQFNFITLLFIYMSSWQIGHCGFSYLPSIRCLQWDSSIIMDGSWLTVYSSAGSGSFITSCVSSSFSKFRISSEVSYEVLTTSGCSILYYRAAGKKDWKSLLQFLVPMKQLNNFFISSSTADLPRFSLSSWVLLVKLALVSISINSTASEPQ